MKLSLIASSSLLFSNLAFAGYNFDLPAQTYKLQLNDGSPVANAVYDYYVFASHLEIPCMGDMGPTGLKCWKGTTLEAGKLTTNAEGEFEFPAKHFEDDSIRDRNYETNPLSISFWGVMTPFKDQFGIDRKCVSVSAYALYQAKINMKSVDATTVMIDLNVDQMKTYLAGQIQKCVGEVDRIWKSNGGNDEAKKMLDTLPYFIAN